jgi:hypothetical protein
MNDAVGADALPVLGADLTDLPRHRVDAPA